MKVLQVTPYFAPAWAYGGPPRVMHDYAVGLAARGHTVDVFTTDVLDDARRAQPPIEQMEGVRVRRFPNLSNDLAWRSKKYLPRGFAAAVFREARNYDIVHATDARTYLTAAASLAARTQRVPFCLSAHGSLPSSTGLRGAVKRAYDAVLVRPMLRNAALLLAQTEHEEWLYAQFGAPVSSVQRLPLPLPPIGVEPAEVRGEFRTRLGVDADVRLLLFLGRINHLKGVDVLVRSVEPLLGAGVVLALVGRDDGELAALRHEFAPLLADGRVRLGGAIYGRDRFAAYVDADVFCLTPRHWEETSVAALEAAACGTPIVVTEQADVPGIQAAGGGLVVPNDEGAIREAVRAVLARSNEMGASARAHVLAQHDRRVVVDRLEQLLQDAI